MRAACDDGLERHRVRPHLEHEPLEPPRNVSLSQPHPDLRQEQRQRLVGEPARGCQRLDLGVVLHRTQRLHLSAERHHDKCGTCLLQVSARSDREVIGLDPDPDDALSRRQGSQRQHGVALDHDLDVGALGLDLREVTEVGGETVQALCRHEDGTVRSAEAGQIAGARQGADQERLDARVAEQ